MSKQEQKRIKVKVVLAKVEAENIHAFELVPLEDGGLPTFTPGAHIDVFMSDGNVRQYSLIGEDTGERYRIAVALDAASRGGSRWMHETLRVGQVLEISSPRNHFPLAQSGGVSLLFAGGIGITPIFSMVQALDGSGRSWRLFYAARSRRNAAFVQELESYGDNCTFHFDDEESNVPDLASIVEATPHDAHFYCCGPTGMLDAFRTATQARPADHVHLEVFATEEPAATGEGFSVELARSGKTVSVAPGETILDALLAAGVDAPSSCRNGVCGTCETAVLSGEPDHRDMILSEDEKAAGDTMMICCSGSKSARLVLDI